MDMSIQLKAESGAICTLSLSFNNDGPLGTFFRYIGDTATCTRYDDLVNGKEEPIDVSKVACRMNGIELQDREFVAAIREGREPNSSVARCSIATACWANWSSSSRRADLPTVYWKARFAVGEAGLLFAMLTIVVFSPVGLRGNGS
jgi:hypothetical protein